MVKNHFLLVSNGSFKTSLKKIRFKKQLLKYFPPEITTKYFAKQNISYRLDCKKGF